MFAKELVALKVAHRHLLGPLLLRLPKEISLTRRLQTRATITRRRRRLATDCSNCSDERWIGKIGFVGRTLFVGGEASCSLAGQVALCKLLRAKGGAVGGRRRRRREGGGFFRREEIALSTGCLLATWRPAEAAAAARSVCSWPADLQQIAKAQADKERARAR